ncbi:MAG: helix-turn-helix domain-containing protein [Burkholderiales bacterium]
MRERAEELPDLARHILRKAHAQGLPAKRLEAAATERLKSYDWPGNVRELENLLRRLAVLSTGDIIHEELVAAELAAAKKVLSAEEERAGLASLVECYLAKHFAEHGKDLPLPGLYDRILREVERPLISLCLAAVRGNQVRAAQLLGLNRNTLRKKMKEYGIK